MYSIKNYNLPVVKRLLFIVPNLPFFIPKIEVNAELQT